ncbi:MAG TPA: hypothetical protein VN818_06405 [Gammaproteobacteria bacterium]|nr:hypothetical protein [Gammaproteobacteria bacterium]
MKQRRSASMAAAAAALVGAFAFAQAPVHEHEPEAWTRKTSDGQPDLRGTWVNFDSTPFESDTTGPLGTIPNVNPPAHWADHDSPVSAKRTSMVVDPPDGRVPVMKWAEDKRDYDLAHLEDHYKHETAWVRCITRGVPGGMFPAGYNNGYEIVQIPGYVIIVYEMIHDTRIIPLDGRPHVGASIRLWNGDPRGHFEGNTLVVDTTNFNALGSIATSAATGRIRGIPHSEELNVVERFTRVSEDVIEYSVTVTDPKVYTAPWTVALPLNRDPSYVMFEYACHEGNLALPNALHAGRVREAAAQSAR